MSRLPSIASEATFQAGFADELGSCERELRAEFAPPRHLPTRPPQTAIDQILARHPKKRLPKEGRDPCSSRAKLDILWKSPAGPVPIELKYCAERKSDVYGYQFLKDLHRLERMVSAGSHAPLLPDRFAAFVTLESVFWRGGRPEPKPFWLTNGRHLKFGHWVQYDQTSPDTLWFSYPPFFLTHDYDFVWRDLHEGWRCLLVPVRAQ